MKPRLYLETTIPSYLVARRSRDLRLAADQETTQQWWEAERHDFLLFISTTALKEARGGDPVHAAAREPSTRRLARHGWRVSRCWATCRRPTNWRSACCGTK